ncbi:MAG: SgcJ/EcaC family oxidoreductase [Gemmatimonadetes bacterium]|nr:SgcJ/EcaC family oxidoreductase [Gemmatimonadota bacterium]
MRTRSAVGLSLVMLVVFAACQAPPAAAPAPPAGLTDADRAAIQSVSDELVQGVLAGNFAAVTALYTEDGMVLPPNGPAVSGRTAIQAFFETFPPMTAFSLSSVEILGSGDMAVVRGTFNLTMNPPGGDALTDTGKYIEVRHRQADGRWLISHDIFNSDVPLPGT